MGKRAPHAQTLPWLPLWLPLAPTVGTSLRTKVRGVSRVPWFYLVSCSCSSSCSRIPLGTPHPIWLSCPCRLLLAGTFPQASPVCGDLDSSGEDGHLFQRPLLCRECVRCPHGYTGALGLGEDALRSQTSFLFYINGTYYQRDLTPSILTLSVATPPRTPPISSDVDLDHLAQVVACCVSLPSRYALSPFLSCPVWKRSL